MKKNKKKKNNTTNNKSFSNSSTMNRNENAISQAFQLVLCWEDWGLYSLLDDTNIYTALRNGEYVIGYDFSPSTNGIVYHNVFHYSNGKLEIFRFVPSATLVLPCKLLRDYTILIPEQDIETYINLLVKPHFDGFLVNRGDKFLDIKNLPKSKIGNSSI